MSRHAIASVAALVGEPTRAAILLALLDGRALPAGELAREARLSAAATSLHLAKLTRGGLLVARTEGRHRYFRLASDDVAHALEALGVVATAPPPARALTPEKAALRAARSCYDHLAGVLGVALRATLEREGFVRPEGERAYVVTRAGEAWLSSTLGVEIASLDARRPIARRCLDWTERRPHVAGALGAAILTRLLALGWLARTPTRALRVTTRGEASFARLGVTC